VRLRRCTAVGGRGFCHQCAAAHAWVIKNFLDYHVTMDVTRVIGHYAMTVVRAGYDGECDKTNTA
jgi:hypothetical protein